MLPLDSPANLKLEIHVFLNRSPLRAKRKRVRKKTSKDWRRRFIDFLRPVLSQK
jgi:hypothetical protein